MYKKYFLLSYSHTEDPKKHRKYMLAYWPLVTFDKLVTNCSYLQAVLINYQDQGGPRVAVQSEPERITL